MTTVAQRSLRDAFARAGYTQESLARALGVPEPVGAAAARANARRLDGSPLGTLARLFLEGETLPRREDDWPDRVRAWLQGTACDAWLVRYVSEDPLEYALKWTTEEAAGRWTAYYEAASIGMLTTGGLVLRKRADGAGVRLATADAEAGPTGSASDQIERVFDALEFAGDLRDERVRLAPHILDEQLAWVDGAYRHVRLAIRLDDGAGVEVAVDPVALPALFALDGSRRVRDLPGSDDALPTIRRLFDAGFVGRV